MAFLAIITPLTKIKQPESILRLRLIPSPAIGTNHLCVLSGRTIRPVKLLVNPERFGSSDSCFVLRGLLLLLHRIAASLGTVCHELPSFTWQRLPLMASAHFQSRIIMLFDIIHYVKSDDKSGTLTFLTLNIDSAFMPFRDT